MSIISKRRKKSTSIPSALEEVPEYTGKSAKPEKLYELSSVRKWPKSFKELTEQYEKLFSQVSSGEGNKTALQYMGYAVEFLDPQNNNGIFHEMRDHHIIWLENQAEFIHQAYRSGKLCKPEVDKNAAALTGYLGLLILIHKGGHWVESVKEHPEAGHAVEVGGSHYYVPAQVRNRLKFGKKYDLRHYYQTIPYTIPVDMTRPFYIQYCDGNQECIKEYTGQKCLHAIFQIRQECSGHPNCNSYVIDDGGKSYPELWIEVNGAYAYLYIIDSSSSMAQSLNDGNELDPDGETYIPMLDEPWQNFYFVSIKTAIQAAIEFCETKTRPTCIYWSEL